MYAADAMRLSENGVESVAPGPFYRSIQLAVMATEICY